MKLGWKYFILWCYDGYLSTYSCKEINFIVMKVLASIHSLCISQEYFIRIGFISIFWSNFLHDSVRCKPSSELWKVILLSPVHGTLSIEVILMVRWVMFPDVFRYRIIIAEHFSEMITRSRCAQRKVAQWLIGNANKKIVWIGLPYTWSKSKWII